jgi:hypothetical protein
LPTASGRCGWLWHPTRVTRLDDFDLDENRRISFPKNVGFFHGKSYVIGFDKKISLGYNLADFFPTHLVTLRHAHIFLNLNN